MNAERTTIRRVAVGLAVAAVLATSACAAGQQAETSQELPTLDGTNANVGGIALRGLAVVTPDAATYAKGSNPQLRVVIVNNSGTADQLTSISSTATDGGWGAYANSLILSDASATTAAPVPGPTVTGTPIEATPTDGSTESSAPTNSAPTSTAPAADEPISLARGVAVSFGVPAADGRILALLGTKSTLYPGSSIAVTFTFAKAGSSTVQVPIQLSDNGSYSPSPSYIPGASASEGAAQKEEGS